MVVEEIWKLYKILRLFIVACKDSAGWWKEREGQHLSLNQILKGMGGAKRTTSEAITLVHSLNIKYRHDFV